MKKRDEKIEKKEVITSDMACIIFDELRTFNVGHNQDLLIHFLELIAHT